MYPPPPDAHTVDTVFAIIAVAALVIGLISMSVGRVVEWWDEGLQKARGVNDYDDDITSSEPGSDEDVPGSDTGSRRSVPQQQHQPAPAAPASFEDIIDYLARHNLDTPEQVVDVLSVLQLGDSYVLSANKIRDIVGGNEAVVKARVASHRPKAEPAPMKASSRLERPTSGWRA